MSARPVRVTGRIACRHSQGGSLLIEFMVFAALALALAVWGSHEWADRVRVLQARSLAAWMQTAQAAAQAHLLRSRPDPDDGEFAPPLEGTQAGWVAGPSWESLQAAGLLPAGWQTTGPLGQQLVLQLGRGPGCAPSACPLQALVRTAAPLLDRRGRVDQAMIAEWLLASQGHGLVFWGREAVTFSGAGRRVMLDAAAQASLASGMVALLAEVPGSGPSDGAAGEQQGGDLSVFLRVRDERDPDFQNDLSARGVVRSATRLAARESVVLEDGLQAAAACSHEGALAREQAYPGVLVCRQGSWRLIARAPGGGYMLNSHKGCRNVFGSPTHNPYTGGCSCAAGFTELQVSESGTLASPDGVTAGYLCVPV